MKRKFMTILLSILFLALPTLSSALDLKFVLNNLVVPQSNIEMYCRGGAITGQIGIKNNQAYTFADGNYQLVSHYGSHQYGSFTVAGNTVTVDGALVYDSSDNIISFDTTKLAKVAILISDIDEYKNSVAYFIPGVATIFGGDRTFYLPDGSYNIYQYHGENYGTFTIKDRNVTIPAEGYLKLSESGNGDIAFDLAKLTKITITRGNELGVWSSIHNIGGLNFIQTGSYTLHLLPGTYDVTPRGNFQPYGKLIIDTAGNLSTTDLLEVTNSDTNTYTVAFDIERAPRLTIKFDELSETSDGKNILYAAVYELLGSANQVSALFPLESQFWVHEGSAYTNRLGEILIGNDGYVTPNNFIAVDNEAQDGDRIHTTLIFKTCDLNAVTITPNSGKKYWFHPHFSTYQKADIYVPSGTYKVYSDGNLSLTFTVGEDSLAITQDNGLGQYLGLTRQTSHCQPVDRDSDNVIDEIDNCPDTPNQDQVDQDLDGLGNECDDDIDGDGAYNLNDNCPNHANADQMDFDGDAIGDVCDNDDDNDSVNDTIDNCPSIANTDQADNDQDGSGDVCDSDDDNDLVLDDIDNCPLVANANQLDFDQDGIGDACDGDTDGDGVGNSSDTCINTPAGVVINSAGCSGAQFIAASCIREAFPQHGKYVSCVAHAANEAVKEGLLSPQEKSRFVSQAAKK